MACLGRDEEEDGAMERCRDTVHGRIHLSPAVTCDAGDDQRQTHACIRQVVTRLQQQLERPAALTVQQLLCSRQVRRLQPRLRGSSTKRSAQRLQEL
jgi:hypothetical protein